jgi:peptide/nickel transport system permease protein
MLDVLGSDYVRTARAKGAPERTVLFHHALRNALLPILTVAGLQFGNLISGALLVETVFNWPGMGRLAFDSILRRDYPTVLGVLFFASTLVVLVNLLTDFSYRFVDPRLRGAS